MAYNRINRSKVNHAMSFGQTTKRPHDVMVHLGSIAASIPQSYLSILIPMPDISGHQLQIPGATTSTVASTTTQAVNSVNKLCGRIFASEVAIAIGVNAIATVCSRTTPFRVGVHFDSNEFLTTASAMQNIAETFGTPGGYIGFKLYFYQQKC